MAAYWKLQCSIKSKANGNFGPSLPIHFAKRQSWFQKNPADSALA